MPQEVHRSRSDSPPYEAAPQRSLPERLKPIRSYGVRRGSAASEVHLSGFSVPLTYHDLVSMSGREYRQVWESCAWIVYEALLEGGGRGKL